MLNSSHVNCVPSQPYLTQGYDESCCAFYTRVSAYQPTSVGTTTTPLIIRQRRSSNASDTSGSSTSSFVRHILSAQQQMNDDYLQCYNSNFVSQNSDREVADSYPYLSIENQLERSGYQRQVSAEEACILLSADESLSTTTKFRNFLARLFTFCLPVTKT